MTKKISALLAVLLAFTLLFAGCGQKVNVTVAVKQNDTVTLQKTYSVDKEATVEDILVKYADELGATLEDSQYGKYITGINGYLADATKNEFVEFQVDGVPADVGISSVTVEEGKVYTFNITTW